MPAKEIHPPPLEAGETFEQLELMRAGEPYLASDPYLCRVRQWGQDKVYEINKTSNLEERMKIFEDFVGMPEGEKKEVYITTPFFW